MLKSIWFPLVSNSVLACLVMATSAGVLVAEQDDDPKTQDDPNELTIGSTAPTLDIEHWFSLGKGRFSEVSDFEAGNVYVVEFWATWCGPCISSMPHLVEVQNRHAEDGVQIISISDESESKVQAFLKRPVRGAKPQAKSEDDEDGEDDEDAESEPMTYGELTNAYCLTTDPDRSVYRDYMTAAAQNGIPTSFIVGKSGLIEWIGHPMSMDEPLEAVIDGSWDRASFAKEFEEELEFKRSLVKVRSLVRRKEFGPALAILEEAKESATGQNKRMADFYFQRYFEQQVQAWIRDDQAEVALKDVASRLEAATGEDEAFLQQQRLFLLVNLGRHEDAVETLTEIIPNLDAYRLNQAAWGVYEQLKEDKEEVPDELLSVAIKASELALEKEPKQPAIYDTLAHLVYLSGNLQEAFKLQSRAMELSTRPQPQIRNFYKKLEAELKESGELDTDELDADELDTDEVQDDKEEASEGQGN